MAHSDQSRTVVGKRAGYVGMLCNTLLAVGKIAVGAVAGSMAVTADGLNNLSDVASSVLTLLGFKFAEKPADKEHPYGHARYEYLAGLMVSVLMLFLGFELGKTSVLKMIDPTPLAWSPLLLAMLAVSVAVKVGMALYFRRKGQAIASKALLATATDCRNDAVVTASILAAAVIEYATDWNVDGAMGLLVAVFILYSGLRLAKETVSPLLGERVDPELCEQLTAYIESCPLVIGCHDLMVHDYGPSERYASVHVEMDNRIDALVCHEAIDTMERECLERFGIHFVIHHDPVVVGDQQTERLRRLVETLLRVQDVRFSVHDFRVIPRGEAVELAFDITVPADRQGDKETIQTTLTEALSRLEDEDYILRITFDLI